MGGWGALPLAVAGGGSPWIRLRIRADWVCSVEIVRYKKYVFNKKSRFGTEYLRDWSGCGRCQALLPGVSLRAAHFPATVRKAGTRWRQHFLNFRPDPQGQDSLRPIFGGAGGVVGSGSPGSRIWPVFSSTNLAARKRTDGGVWGSVRSTRMASMAACFSASRVACIPGFRRAQGLAACGGAWV